MFVVRILGSLSSSHTLPERSRVHNRTPVFPRGCLLPRAGKTDVQWSQIDSIALSHVWLGLPGGHFQSGGGLRITAAAARCWSSVGSLRAFWPKNLNRRSVTVLERGVHSDNVLSSALIYDENNESLRRAHVSNASVYPCAQLPCCGPRFTTVHQD